MHDAFPEGIVGKCRFELGVVGQEFGVERDPTTVVALERAAHVLERRADRAGNRLDRERDAGSLGDVEAVREQREVLGETSVADGKLPQVKNHDRRAERGGEAAVAPKLRKRCLGILEQLRADPLVRVRRREPEPCRAEVVLDPGGVPGAADPELEAVDVVEAWKPLEDCFVRRRVREAIDETRGGEASDHLGTILAHSRHIGSGDVDVHLWHEQANSDHLHRSAA